MNHLNHFCRAVRSFLERRLKKQQHLEEEEIIDRLI